MFRNNYDNDSVTLYVFVSLYHGRFCVVTHQANLRSIARPKAEYSRLNMLPRP
jgi:hypothetical protein